MKQKLSVKKPVSKPGAVETDVRKPTRDQKREIMSLLETVYDTAAERYKSGDTDDSIADVLNVMPGWVAEIREEFFGPAGHNEDIDTLMKNLERLHADADAAMEQAAKSIAALKAIQKDAAAYKGDLSKVKRALSPRHGIH